MARIALSFLAILALLAQTSLVSGQGRQRRQLLLSVIPARPAMGERVRFRCEFSPSPEDAKAPKTVRISLLRMRDSLNILASQDVRCADSSVVWANSTTPSGQLAQPSSCWSLTLEGVTADQGLQGSYTCDLRVQKGDRTHLYSSQIEFLEVNGEASPEVARLAVFDAASGAPSFAGARIRGVCESAPVNPPAWLTVSVAGDSAPIATALAPDGRLEFQVTVPREPLVSVRCRVYNGFGQPQTAEIAFNVVYGPTPGNMTMLQEAKADGESEQLLCSAGNNPPERLKVTGLAPELLEPGYPRFVEKPGLSAAYVKFRKAASGDRLVTFTCGVAGIQAQMGALHLKGTICDRYFWIC